MHHIYIKFEQTCFLQIYMYINIYENNLPSYCLQPRWTSEQIYVNTVVSHEDLPQGLSANKKNGATLTVRKRGGWAATFEMAKKIGGWV